MKKLLRFLFESGMHCLGCSMAMEETIGQGCLAHGMSEKQIDELVEKLNEKDTRSQARENK